MGLEMVCWEEKLDLKNPLTQCLDQIAVKIGKMQNVSAA